MKFLFCFIFLLVSTAAHADDWGQTGHRTTAAIADQYLSKKAKRNIATLLGHESLAVVSTYADEIKSDGVYRYLNPQHYVNIPFDKTYDTHPHSEKGDIITAIDNCIAIIKSDTATDGEKAFQLRLLVHFIGDLHQPLHTGLKEDKGGNDFQVTWFRKGTNLHAVWDSKMIDSYGMSYSELASNAPSLSRKEFKAISQGTHRDWLVDSRVVVKDIYQNVATGDTLGYRYMYDYTSVMKHQLLKGGTRLAALLNELFG
jgi:hypothetical protein